MILTDLLRYLDDTLAVGVYAESPKTLTDYVLIEQTGSSRNNQILTATVAIQSYGKSMLDAMTLNDEVETAMEGFVQLDRVARVELETDYNFTNTETKQYRWQAVYNITYYRR